MFWQFYSPINSKYSHEMCMKMEKYVYMCVQTFTQDFTLRQWLDM